MEKKTVRTLITSFITMLLLEAVIIFSLYQSNAWFNMNKNVGGNGMQIQATSDNGANLEAYSVYKYNGLLEKAEEVSNSENKNFFAMTEFDTVFFDRNVNTPIVIKMTLSSIPNDHPEIDLAVTCLDDHWTDDDGNLMAYFSNIINFRAVTIASLNGVTDADQIYTDAKAIMIENTADTFAKLSQSGANSKKELKISTTLSDYDSAVYNTDMLDIYIMLDYEADLAGAYIDQNGINVHDVQSQEAGKDFIDFEYDIEKFRFDFKEGE